jgi:hypothetical protein
VCWRFIIGWLIAVQLERKWLSSSHRVLRGAVDTIAWLTGPTPHDIGVPIWQGLMMVVETNLHSLMLSITFYI